MKKIYVGNLGSLTSGMEVQTLFESYGKVLRAGVLANPDTGESRGFGYVLMSDDEIQCSRRGRTEEAVIVAPRKHVDLRTDLVECGNQGLDVWMKRVLEA